MTNVWERIAALSPKQRELLEQRIKAARLGEHHKHAIKRRRERDSFPLSFAQQRLWFLDQFEPCDASYNNPIAYRFTGPLDVSAVERALNEIVRRHEILRTVFVTEYGQPAQVVRPEMPVKLRVVDLRCLADGMLEQEAHRLAGEEAQQPFDLANGPLLRAVLFRLREEECIVLLTMHHIVCDAWSVSILMREMAVLYEASTSGRPSPLPPLPIQYADYAAWQREWLQGETLQRELAFWRTQLADAPALLELPTDRPRPPVQSSRGGRYVMTLPAPLSQEIKSLSRREGETLFVVLLAAFQVLLYRYTNQTDLVVGTPVTNRSRVEVEPLIGLFLNTLALRTRLTGRDSFRQLVRQVAGVMLAARAHQEVPFERVVEAVGSARTLSHTPLFQMMFTLVQRAAAAASERAVKVGDILMEPDWTESDTAKFDLTLALEEHEQFISASFEYSSDLFDRATIIRMAQHYERLLAEVVSDPERPLDQLTILTQDERRQLLIEWNDTAQAYPHEQCVHQLFEAQARQTPAAVALVSEGQRLTYQELNQRANRLAHHLRAQGVGPDSPVGVLVERSVEMVVAVLGVLKAGGAFLPLEPTYPRERLRFMLEDSRADVLLTQQYLAAELPDMSARIICLDDAQELTIDYDADDLKSEVAADNLAYVLYVSDASGQPKGVMTTHGAVRNRLLAMQAAYQLTAADCVLQKAPLGCDVSVWELFWPLLAGGRLVVARPGRQHDSDYLAQLIAAEQVTTLHFVPSMLDVFLAAAELEKCRSLRRVFCDGETLSFDLQQRFFARLAAGLHNLYGPTEATIAATDWACERESDLRIVPIGRPIANAQIYILDTDMQPTPIGVVGEIYIGGEGLARGYLRRPALTAEKFIPHPFSQSPAARLYKTGDMGRYLPDGQIEFVGRRDRQIKVSGQRIETGEIETCLRTHPRINETVVVTRADDGGEQRLVAYLVSREELTADELRSYLQQRIPAHMIPSAFVMLDALPLTSGGKVDRQALPAPTQHSHTLTDTFTAPRTDAERLLTEVWCEVLNLRRVGLHDNFFALGGDSILSIQVVARAARLGLRLTPRQMFEHQTVAELAAAAEQTTNSAEQSAAATDTEDEPSSNHVPLTPIQRWFFTQDVPEPHHFNQAVMLTCRRQLERQLLARALDALVARHDALRLRFERTAEGWQQRVVAPAEACGTAGDIADDDAACTARVDASPNSAGSVLHVLDLAHVADAELKQAIERAAAQAQATLDLARGPVLRVVHFVCGHGRADRLLVVAHHLAVDGVSWRILLEELDLAYAQLARGAQVELPPQTASFRRWAARLETLAASAEVRAELDFWAGAHDAINSNSSVSNNGNKGSVAESNSDDRRALFGGAAQSLPRDLQGENKVASEEIVTVHFTSDETRALIQQLPALYNASVEEALLSALARVLGRWSSTGAVAIDVEGHGREQLWAGLDLSRTVGWFTSIYPLLLETRDERPAASLARVSAALRRVPRRGVGYGLLRYLSDDAAVAHILKSKSPAEVLFNYLGRFEDATANTHESADDNQGSVFALSEETAGATRSTQAPRTHQLEFSAGIFSGRLQLSCTYSRQRHHRQTIAGLCHTLRRELLALAGAPLVALQPFGQKPPLFLLHPSGGQVMCYLGLARRLGSERPVYGLRGFDAEGCFDQTLAEMATRQVAEIKRVAGVGPYLLAGWSFGAVLAYEVAQQLRAAGGEVALLAILDIGAPLERVLAQLAEREERNVGVGAGAGCAAAGVSLEDYDPERDRAQELARLLGQLAGREFAVSAEELRGLSQQAQVARVVALAGAAGVVPAGMGKAEVLRTLRGYQTRQRAARAYRAEKYAGRVAVFVSREVSAEERALRAELYGADETLGWAELVAPLPQVLLVDGSHQTIVLEPYVKSLAEKLRECLDKAEAVL